MQSAFKNSKGDMRLISRNKKKSQFVLHLISFLFRKHERDCKDLAILWVIMQQATLNHTEQTAASPIGPI